jgi:hypothetical protein
LFRRHQQKQFLPRNRPRMRNRRHSRRNHLSAASPGMHASRDLPFFSGFGASL